LIKIDKELNRKVLCESCKRKKLEKLIKKYGNEQVSKFLYQCKLNPYGDYYNYYCCIRWIPFNEFRNIEYLAKGGFGEVHKATWINGCCYYGDQEKVAVLKRIYYNSSDKIADILKEVYC